jgi:SAM-dependent methyltransferase
MKPACDGGHLQGWAGGILPLLSRSIGACVNNRKLQSARRTSLGAAMASNVEDHPYREFERAGWARAASCYADSFEAITRLFTSQLLEAIGAGPQTKVLDVACGSAYMTAMAAATGAQVEGVDFSPNMVDEAKRRYSALSFRQADAEALPFADNTSQPADKAAALITAVESAIERYQEDGVFKIPAAAILAVGVKA